MPSEEALALEPIHVDPPVLPIFEALKKRYKDPEYVLLREVRSQTGYQERDTTYADAIAFSTWPSRGLEIVGIEIKVSRSDWLREKKNPKKAESIFRFCDKWYLVTTEDVRVDVEELPITYGHLVLKKRGLVTAREAPVLQPVPPTRAFLASCLRNATARSASTAELAAARKSAAEDAAKFWKDNFERDTKDLRERHERLRQTAADFEEASGVKLNDRWISGNAIGKAVAVILAGGPGRVLEDVGREKDSLARDVQALERSKPTEPP